MIWLELAAAAIGGAVIGWFTHILFRGRVGRERGPKLSVEAARTESAEPPFDVQSHAPPPIVSSGIAPKVSEGADLAGKVIAHLATLGRLGNDEVGRLGFTQAGMSAALDIRQGTLTKVLSRLEGAQVLEVDRRHVRGQSRRLNVYRLTALGESVAKDIRHRSPAATGIPVKPLTVSK